MLLQAYDFHYLYEKHNCYIQSGGSDQWGNIVAGIDLIKQKNGADKSQAAGLTVNLLTNSVGKKFGKSEQGAIFLDSSKTTEYTLYQFLVNQEDTDVIKLLKALTFLDEKTITLIDTLHTLNPALRTAQKVLAAAITTYVHKCKGYFAALKLTQTLFSNTAQRSLSQNELQQFGNNLPKLIVTESTIPVLDLLLALQIENSKAKLKQLIQANGLSINGTKITDHLLIIEKKHYPALNIIKKGKNHYFIFEWK